MNTGLPMVMGRFVVLVDAGYAYGAAGALALGSTSRREVRLDVAGFLAAVTSRATDQLGGKLLRSYWFDAARNRVLTAEQRQIAVLPNVKVRVGNLNAAGVQKGVDAALRFDLETLARNGAVTDAVLVTGDEDMLPGVESAQAYGVRVHLWGIEPPFGRNQAEQLVWESDTHDVLDGDFIRPFVSRSPEAAMAAIARSAEAGQALVNGSAAAAPDEPKTGASHPTPLLIGPRQLTHAVPSRSGPSAPVMEEIGEHVAHKWILTRGRDHVADLLPGPALPTVMDQELLVEAERELGESLRPYREAREDLRHGFWTRVYREFGVTVGVSGR